ncbi:MAG: hypothetical protein IPO21_10555 [Bacteroidales bacterium]|nr:hypothetical protein [Bacteroidales bacterium]
MIASSELKGEFEIELVNRIIPRSGFFVLTDNECAGVFLDGILELFSHLGYIMKPASGICLTSIITDEEVDEIIKYLHTEWINKVTSLGWVYDSAFSVELKTHPAITPFERIDTNLLCILREFVWFIPVLLFRNKLELMRAYESESLKLDYEISELIARKIHNSYISLSKNNIDNKLENLISFNFVKETQYITNWEALPDVIKRVNLGFAHQMFVKFLSIGYKIEKTNELVPLHIFTDDELEQLSKIEHERWSWQKRIDGFTYAPHRDDALKLHPCLLPYAEISEYEKDKDRVLTAKIPSILQILQLRLIKLKPSEKDKLPYTFQPTSLIENIKRSVLKWHNEIASNKNIPEEIAKELTNTGRFEHKINQLVSSFTAGQQYQQAFITNPLAIQSILPQSFVLFKPRDIVGGDYYFTFQKDDKILCFLGDCLGHSILGALGTMVAATFLEFYTKSHDFDITNVAKLIADIELHFDTKFSKSKSANGANPNGIKSIPRVGAEKYIDAEAYCIDKSNNCMYVAGNLKHVLVLSNNEVKFEYVKVR